MTEKKIIKYCLTFDTLEEYVEMLQGCSAFVIMEKLGEIFTDFHAKPMIVKKLLEHWEEEKRLIREDVEKKGLPAHETEQQRD